jgi:hypothetical protein
MLGAAHNPYNLPPAFVPAQCTEQQEQTAAARRYIDTASEFLTSYRYVLEAHPVEFLIQRPMDRLPPAWLAELPEIEQELDLTVLLGEQPDRSDGPPAGRGASVTLNLGTQPRLTEAAYRCPRAAGDDAGLLGFFRKARALHMPRQPSAALEAAVAAAGTDPSSVLQPLAQELRMFTNPKKIHEVERL